jgi:dihydropyrimidinase
MIPRFDLVVRAGTIVTPGHREVADLGVRDGRIAQIGGAMTGEGELGAHGLLVIPGGVDAHVHLVCAALAEAVGSAQATSTRSAAITRRGLSRPSSTRPWTW